MTTTDSKTSEGVRLQSLHIRGLFGLFDYDIDFPEGEQIRIITGPNGFGKTQVLNIIDALFNERLIYFYYLIYKTIEVKMSDGASVKIERLTDETIDELLAEEWEYDEESGQRFSDKVRGAVMKFTFQIKGRRISDAEVSINDLKRDMHLFIPKLYKKESVEFKKGKQFYEKSYYTLDDRKDGERFTAVEVIANYYPMHDYYVYSKMWNKLRRKLIPIAQKSNVHLIREQRLIKRDTAKGEDDQYVVTAEDTLKQHAVEVRAIIAQARKAFIEASEHLNSNYTKRLFEFKKENELSKEAYEKEKQALIEKFRALAAYDLHEELEDDFSYSKEDAKALTLYLEDLKTKTSVFDEWLERFELFTGVVNNLLLFKNIHINQEKGFSFETETGGTMAWSQLSSGERHQMALLYELIFKVKPNSIVLIDEPEISLHVTWQKAFIKDLQKIIALNNFQAIIATHAPAIIHGRWDLVYNLSKEKVEA